MSKVELEAQGRLVRDASQALAQASNEQRCAVLRRVADRLEDVEDELLAVNAEEVATYEESGPGRDRLMLNSTRVRAMADALREIADAPDPLFEILDRDVRPNGLRVERVRVPLGVIGVVYENRPNVTSDVAGLCVRSGNAAYLRGSSSAMRTNRFIVALWNEALAREGLPEQGVALVEDPSYETATAFMQMTDVLDCLIPRGGPSLIAAMREHARVPYVLDGDGNCHVYVDEFADGPASATPPRRCWCTRRWRPSSCRPSRAPCPRWNCERTTWRWRYWLVRRPRASRTSRTSSWT